MCDFLDAVMTLLARAPAETATLSPEGSLLAAPMAALAGSPRSFDTVYGGAGLLQRQAEAAEAADDAALAGLLRDIGNEIARGTLRPPAQAKAVRRFTGFVYPVI